MAATLTKHELAQRAWFKAEIGRRLEALGAVAPDGTYDYALATVAGNLFVTAYDDWVACRFEEPERAKATVSDTRLNPCSGKWNHIYDAAMFADRRHAQLAVDYFFIELDRYL